jgi:hypothetical protein
MSNEETEIAMSIGRAIASSSKLNTVQLYDLIMENKDVATKGDLIFLLERMGRPPVSRESQEQRKSTLKKLTCHMEFNKEPWNVDITADFNKTTKRLILEWLDALVPENRIEKTLKREYLEALKEADKGITTKAECFKAIYLKVKKDILSYG